MTRPKNLKNEGPTFYWEPDKTIVELIRCENDLRFVVWDSERRRCSIEEKYRLPGTEKTKSPPEWLKQFVPYVLRLPSGVVQPVSTAELAARIKTFIHRYFDCSSEFEDVATLFALATWVYEAFDAVPYLRFLGPPGAGKSRGTTVIGAVCYRSLSVNGSITPAIIFRMIDVIGGTMLLDEADFEANGIGSEIAKILNGGYKRGVGVPRNEKDKYGNWVPAVFDTFGPKIINGRKRIGDDATEDRCLTFRPIQTCRSDIPKQLPKEFHEEAESIRNLALTWRLRRLDRVPQAAIEIPGLSPRANELLAPLWSVANMFQPEDMSALKTYLESVLAFMNDRETEKNEERANSVEAKLIQAFCEWKATRQPSPKDLTTVVIGEMSDDDPAIETWLTPKKAGQLLTDLGFDTSGRSNRGKVVRIHPQRLEGLRKTFGLERSTDGGPTQETANPNPQQAA